MKDKQLAYIDGHAGSARDAAGSAEHLRVGSDELAVRVTSEATLGALLAVEVRLPPGGGPPALHRHAPDEIYRLERGQLAIYLEQDDGEVQRIEADPGDVVHIPANRSHTVRNESAAEAVAYVVFAPGTDMERFLRAAGALAAEGPPRAADVVALAEQHGIVFTGPVPAVA